MQVLRECNAPSNLCDSHKEEKKMKKWTLKLLYTPEESGQDVLHIYDHEGRFRPVEFHTKSAAKEAQCIVSKLITGSNFQGSIVMRLP